MRVSWAWRSMAWLALVALAGCGGGGGGGPAPGDSATVMGWVRSVAEAASQVAPEELELRNQPPNFPTEGALVEIVAGGTTYQRRTAADGSFAAVVPPGEVTIQAFPMPFRTEQSGSKKVTVQAAAGQVTLPNGSSAGAQQAAVRLVDYYPLKVGDARYWRAQDGTDGGWEFVAGTADVGGRTAYVELTAPGRPAFVEQPSATQAVAEGQLWAHGGQGSLLYTGGVELLEQDSGDLEFRSQLFTQTLEYPPGRLGQEVALEGTMPAGSGQPLDVTLAAGTTLENLRDADSYTWDPGFEGEQGTGTLILAAVGQKVETPAGVFTDTITLDWVTETAGGGPSLRQWERTVLARGVGPIVDQGEAYDQAAEAVSQVADQWADWVTYAVVSGTEYGTYPAGGGAPPTGSAEAPTDTQVASTGEGLELSWLRPNTSLPIESYRIQGSPDGVSYRRIDGGTVAGNVTTVTDRNVQQGTTYTYRIRAFYLTGEVSGWAEFPPTVYDPPLPAAEAPGSLNSEALTTGVRLSWSAPDTTLMVDSYRIRKSTDEVNYTRIDDDLLGPGATAFSDGLVQEGALYHYRIRVIYTTGETSAWVDFPSIRFENPGGPPPPPPL